MHPRARRHEPPGVPRVRPEHAARAGARGPGRRAGLFRVRYGTELASAITAGGHFSRGGSRAVRHLIGGGFRDRLLSYGGPILAINGVTDLVFTLGAKRFLRDIPRATYRVIPRAGHLSNVDRSEAFTGLVEDFIGTLEP